MDNNISNVGGNLTTASVILESKSIACPNCGCTIFREATILKSVSRLYTGGSKDGIVPVPIYVCDKCGTPARGLMDEASEEKLFGPADKKSSLTI